MTARIADTGVSQRPTPRAAHRLAVASLALWLCWAGAAPAEPWHATQLLERLQARDFVAVTEHLEALQQRYESGEGTDSEVARALSALANGDPALAWLFDEWVTLMPDRFEPYAARGRYRFEVGWLMRGTRYSRETSQAQFDGMREQHELAIADLRRAIELNARDVNSWAALISLHKTGNPLIGNDVSVLAMQADPYSYELHRAVLVGLMPRWGGSFEEIEQHIAPMRALAGHNPRLESLAGFAHYVRARGLRSKRRYAEALSEHEEALSFGGSEWFYKERGITRVYAKDYEGGIADLNAALSLWPDSPVALGWRGYAFYLLKRYDEALADLRIAAVLRPFDARINKNLGRVLGRTKRYEEAVKAFDAALHYNQHRGDLWYLQGWYLLHKLKRPAAALAPLRTATELRRDNPSDWYSYARALSELKDCEVVPTLGRYLQLCAGQSNKRCTDKRIKWAHGSLDALKHANLCTDAPAQPLQTQPPQESAEHEPWAVAASRIIQALRRIIHGWLQGF